MNLKPFNKTIFAERLAELRKDKDISIQRLAKEINISNAAISDWGNSKHIPTAEAIYLLAQYFNVSTDFFFGLSDS